MLHIKQLSNQKGISLLFTVLITSVILGIGLGISGIIIQQAKTMGDIGDSIVSFYAADSGVEEELYGLYKSPSPSPNLPLGSFSVNDNNATFNVQVKCGATSDCLTNFVKDPGCLAANFCLKSSGAYRKTKRAIEINY